MGGIDAVERIKNNMPDEFQRLPPGSFGTCIAKCVNNTEFVGASNRVISVTFILSHIGVSPLLD